MTVNVNIQGVDRGLNVPPIEKDNTETQARLKNTFSKLV